MSDLQKMWEWACAAKRTADTMDAEAERLLLRISSLTETMPMFDIGGRRAMLSASLFHIDGEIDGLWAQMGIVRGVAGEIRSKLTLLKARASELRAQANTLWPGAVAKKYGDVEMLYDSSGNCTLSNGEEFKYPDRPPQANPLDMSAAFAYTNGQIFAKEPRS